MNHPSFEQLLQIARLLARDYEFVRVVLASAEGEARFVEISKGAEFRAELQAASREGLAALGLLGWERSEQGWRAKRMLFSWHADDANLEALFRRLCEMGVDSVKKEFERRGSKKKG